STASARGAPASLEESDRELSPPRGRTQGHQRGPLTVLQKAFPQSHDCSGREWVSRRFSPLPGLFAVPRVVIIGERGSGKATFLGLLYAAQVKSGTDARDGFRFHVTYESRDETTEVIQQLM